MTTSLTIANAVLPAHLATAAMSSVWENATAGLSSGAQHPRISIKASRFRIVEDGAEQTLQTLSLQAVIVGANRALSKQFYEESFDEDATSAPTCFSEDGVYPDSSVANPQHPTCAGCPKASWGSKITKQGKETKACSDLKRLAIVSADDIGGSVYELTVTPAALSGFNKYARELASKRIPAEAVITTLSFDDAASFPKLQFAFGGFLSQDDYLAAKEVSNSDQVKSVVRMKDIPAAPAQVAVAAPVAEVKAAPAPKPAAPKPAPVVEPEPAATPAAPAKTKGFGSKPAAAPAAPVEKVVNEAPAPKKAKPAAPAAEEVSLSDFEAELAAFALDGTADDAE